MTKTIREESREMPMNNLNLFDLNNKKALVTGGSAGIGRACALALGSAGADVAIVDINEQAGQAAVDAIKHLGRDSFYIPCDVTDEQQVQAMVASVVEYFGRLDIAVNNAGIYWHGADEDMPKTDWDRVINVNLTGAWLCAQAEARQMKSQQPAGGKIINIASMAAKIAASNGSYDASKAGVVHLTHSLAAQWGRYNINVNSISPGYVANVFGVVRDEAERQRIREATPLGHVQRLADLYGPVLFFASDASNYVTGQDLVVDGGHTLNVWMKPLERSVPPRVAPEEEAG
jgi:NAD(P)-dependent dehydrogenase (short-subunit alcohol dehydrogenase family)